MGLALSYDEKHITMWYVCMYVRMDGWMDGYIYIYTVRSLDNTITRRIFNYSLCSIVTFQIMALIEIKGLQKDNMTESQLTFEL